MNARRSAPTVRRRPLLAAALGAAGAVACASGAEVAQRADVVGLSFAASTFKDPVLQSGLMGELLGMVTLASLWGIWHIVSGMGLALYWRKKDARLVD